MIRTGYLNRVKDWRTWKWVLPVATAMVVGLPAAAAEPVPRELQVDTGGLFCHAPSMCNPCLQPGWRVELFQYSLQGASVGLGFFVAQDWLKEANGLFQDLGWFEDYHRYEIVTGYALNLDPADRCVQAALNQVEAHRAAVDSAL